MSGSSDLRAQTYFPGLPIGSQKLQTVAVVGVRTRSQRRDRSGISPDSPVQIVAQGTAPARALQVHF